MSLDDYIISLAQLYRDVVANHISPINAAQRLQELKEDLHNGLITSDDVAFLLELKVLW